MTFHALTDLRRVLGDFTRTEYSDPTLKRLLMHSAHEAARRGLLVQEQEVIDLDIGVIEYPLHPRWVQTFALLHEDIQSFLAMRDQANAIWYLTITDLPSYAWSDTKPAGIDLTTATIPHWFRWNTWYVYPSLLGSTTVSDTQPAVGGGLTSTVELRSRGRVPGFLSAVDPGTATVEKFSAAVAAIRAGAPRVSALTLLMPEAFGRVDASLPAGPPHYATVWQERLWVWPVPDARYQLDHKFFTLPLASPEVFDMPAAFMRLPFWKALSVALRSSGKLAPSQSVNDIFDKLLAYYATVYGAAEQDSREELTVLR